MSSNTGFVAVLKDASVHVANPDIIEGDGDQPDLNEYVTKIYDPGTVLPAEIVRDVVLDQVKAGRIPHLVFCETEAEAQALANTAAAVEKRTGEVVVSEKEAEILVAAGVGQHTEEASSDAILSTQGLTASQVAAAGN